MFRNLTRLGRVVRRDGWRVALRKAISMAARQALAVAPGKRDVIAHYEFLLGKEQGLGLKLTPENVPPGSMTWVIPDFNAQSGGHINILRMMALLRQRGFPLQHVVVMEPHRWGSAAEAEAAMVDAFGDHGITVSLGVQSIEPCAYLVATGWQTAYWVSKYRDAMHRLYFVQDFEPAFYPQGTDYALAENTYRQGLVGVTAGTWLADKLAADYGMTTFPYSFACDLELYRPHEKRPAERRYVLFYARPVTPRRCFEIGLLALRQVCAQDPDVTVVFAGWDVGEFEIPFPHLNRGSLEVSELPDLYSQCDVALVLSSTNLSLLPLEVAACGCPMVLNRGPHAEWLLSEDEAFYCDMSVEAIAATVSQALADRQAAATKAAAAQRRAQARTWGTEADKVARFLAAL